MDCTQVLISSPSRDIRPCEEKENIIVAKLTINGITHDIFNRENTIGRGDTCNIIIKNEAISSRHAIIEANDCEEHILYDLGSTNKTKLGKITLKPNVRYFINDGANITFGDELAVYKYVSNFHNHQGTTSFTIPATPEKSETSRLSSPEVLEIKDDDIIESSDIDIFDESFEEEICKKRKDISQSSKIKEDITNDDGGICSVADKKSESHHTENSKCISNKNQEITSVHNLNETLTSQNLSDPETLEGLVDESVDETCLSIYDIPTQTISENGDLFEETNKTIVEAQTDQHVLNSKDAEDREKAFEQTSLEDKEKKDISDIQEADTLDPTDYQPSDISSSKNALSGNTKGTTKHVEVKEHELKEVMYFDEDELNFKGRKVNEMNTQDMLCKSRDMDSDDEIEALSVSNKTNELVMDSQPLSPKEGNTGIKFTASSTLDKKSIADKIIEIGKSESTWSTEKKISLDLLSDKECPGNNDQNNLSHKEGNIVSTDTCNKYRNEKLDKDVSELSNRKASSCKRIDNLFNDKEGDEENINYKEKKIKLSQMMKLSSESAISQRDTTVRSTLDSEVDNSLSELLTKPVFNKNVVSTSEENNVFPDKSSVTQTKNIDREGPALLVNLSLSNMQFQSAESNSRPSANLGNKNTLCKIKNEFESIDKEKVNVISSSMLNKSSILSNEAIKSLNDSDICNEMTQPVLNAGDIREKEGNKVYRKQKELELLNKAEDNIIPEKEELSKGSRAKFEKEIDIHTFEDTDIGDLITQPVLIAEEVREKEENKVYRKQKELELLNKAEDNMIPEKEALSKGSRAKFEKETDIQTFEDTDIGDLMTQPILIAEEVLEKEANKVCRKEKELELLNKAEENTIPEKEELSKGSRAKFEKETDIQTFEDTDIGDLMTQPILIAEEVLEKEANKVYRKEKELELLNKAEDNMITEKEELSKGSRAKFEKETDIQSVDGTDICDLMTQPILIAEEVREKEANKVYRKEKELELLNKAEDIRPKRKALINVRKAVLIEKHTNETNICDLKAEPILTTENLGDKKENKLFGSEKEIKSLLSEVDALYPEIEKPTKARKTAIVEEKRSQNGTDICDLLTQPVILTPEDLHNREENKICKLEKEIKSPNKTEISEKEKVAKVMKTSIGEESDQKSLNDTLICELMTQPVVITPGKESDKGGNKVCRIEKEIESPNKPFYGFPKNGDENEEDDISTMLTQPVLLSDENVKDTNQQTLTPNKCLSNKENKSNVSKDNMLSQVILLPNQFCISENSNGTIKKQTYSSKDLVAGENRKICDTSLNDLSFSSMLTQPISPPDVKNENSDRKDTVDYSGINIKNMEAEIKKNVISMGNLSNSGHLKTNTLTNDKIDRNLHDESISDMLTQPVILEDGISHQREDLQQSSFDKKESDSVAFNVSAKAELFRNETLPSIIEKHSDVNNSPTHREETESLSKDYSNMLTKSFKKNFSKQVIASRKYAESEVCTSSPSNISDNEKSTNKIMNKKEFKEYESQVKEHCSSNHCNSSVDACEDNQVLLKKRKNITLRLKKNKEKKPSIIDGVRKESITKEQVNLEHAENTSDIVIPGGKVAKLQKLSKVHRVPIADGDEEAEKEKTKIKIFENRSVSDENNSGSCKDADISSDKNINEKSICVPESNSKLIGPISRKNVPIITVTSAVKNVINDDTEGKKLQSEMGRGKRRRTKKIFQDFCTDDTSEKVSDDSQENSQNKRTKKDALLGNNSNVESQKILSADRQRKSSKNNQEEELKSKENICRPHLIKKCTRLLDRSSCIAAEEGNSDEISLKETSLGLQNKKKEKENTGKYAIGESDSTIATSDNLKTSHIECVNLGLLESTTCQERWNSPLNTTKMRTYSKKKSLITFAGEQSISDFLHLNESNKNITTEDRAILKDSSFLTGCIGEEVKNRSPISESKESLLPVSSKRNLSKKTNARKTKALIETVCTSNSSSNDNVLKREHEEDNSNLSRNKRSKTKKVDNASNDKKKSTVSPSKPEATEKSEFIKQRLSPVVMLKRYMHSENVDISDKNTSNDKEISSITSRNQRKTKHLREVKNNEPFNEEKHNFPKSSTPIKFGGNSSMVVTGQNIKAEESFASSFSSSKSDESSPARRSGRKRKLNCRLQPFFGPCENVMFTGYSDPKALAIINKLGGQIVDCPKSCTVLVTDKVRRTVKFLCALALGRPIVSPQWLASSKMSLTFLEHDKYLLKDKEAEKQFSFTLKESLAKARRTPLLQGKSIFVTSSVKPPPADMKSIVECSGGTFLTKAPTNWPQNSVIISCNEDKSVFNKFRKKQSNLPIVSTEFILSGILQQDFNPDKYML